MGNIVKKSLVTVLALMVFSVFVFPQNVPDQPDNVESAAQTMQSSADIERSFVFSDGQASASSENNASSGTVPAGRSGIGIFVRMIVALVIIVLLIYGVFWFIKKKSRIAPDDDDYLRRVASISVAPGKSVQVITLIDKAYLIGITEDSITLLGEVNDDELIKAMNLNADKKANVKKAVTFADVLDMFTTKGKQKNVFSDTENKVDNLFKNNG